MNVARTRRLLFVAASLVAVLVASMTYASIVVIYPFNVSISEVSAPVVFQGGTNANQTGLGGTMTVLIGENQTSASISFQVTYQTNYIHDLLEIANTDSISYHVAVRVDSPLLSTTNVVASAELLLDVGNDGTIEDVVDLTTTGTSAEITLPAGEVIALHFKVVLTEGVKLDSAPLTVQLSLLYSPQPGGTNHAP